jgi:outer membrane protein
MKNLTIALNVVLAIAVGGLYYLHFSSKPGQTAQTKDDAQPTEETIFLEDGSEGALANLKTDAKIYYVNTDSLFSSYDYLKKLEEELQVEKKKAEGQLKSKITAFENEYIDLQNRANKGTLSSDEAQRREAALINQEKKIKEYQEKVTYDLLDKEDELKKQVQDHIYAFLKKYQQDKGIDFILGYSRAGGPVLFGNEELEITKEVLEGLNREYKSKTPAKEEKKK